MVDQLEDLETVNKLETYVVIYNKIKIIVFSPKSHQMFINQTLISYFNVIIVYFWYDFALQQMTDGSHTFGQLVV